MLPKEEFRKQSLLKTPPTHTLACTPPPSFCEEEGEHDGSHINGTPPVSRVRTARHLHTGQGSTWWLSSTNLLCLIVQPVLDLTLPSSASLGYSPLPTLCPPLLKQDLSLLFLFMRRCVCRQGIGAHGCQCLQRLKAQDTLELELQRAVSHLT